MTDKNSKIEKTITTVQQISLFILLVAVFLGSLYVFNGNLLIAIPLSVILVAAMYYIVWHMVGAKMGKKRSGFSIGDQMLWLLYVIISIPVMFIVLHAYNVEIQERQTIENQGLEKVKALSELKEEYKNTYEVYLNQTETNMNYYIPKYLNGILKKEQLKNVINVNDAFIWGIDPNNPTATVQTYIEIEREKFQNADSSLFGNTQQYLDVQESKIRNFSRLSINFVLTDLDEKLMLSKENLNTYLSKNAKGKQLEFNIEPYLKPTQINQPLTLLQKQLNPLLLLIIVLINGLMLLPYLIAPSRTYERKNKFSKKPNSTSNDVHEW